MIKCLLLCGSLLPFLCGCGQVAVFGHVIGERPMTSTGEAAGRSAAPTAQTEATDANVATTMRTAPVAALAPGSLHVVRAVSITVSPTAGSEISSGFLLSAIKSELAARGLLDERDSSAATAQIVIERLDKQPRVNAVVFGRQMMAATLEASIALTGGSGADISSSRLTAESRLVIATDGSDKNPLASLYKRFAVLTADRLAGVQSKPASISDDGQPRS